jgi:hypothetical protein
MVTGKSGDWEKRRWSEGEKGKECDLITFSPLLSFTLTLFP